MSDAPSKALEPREKVRGFPNSPGVYLMKDAQGRVIYVGKAKNLRNRASSYFNKTASGDKRICDWIGEVADVDFLAADSEVDALLLEARLIKDIQPRHNQDLKDDKSFPYLQITTGDDFPRVNFTREPLDRGVKLYGPFPRAKSLRARSRSCKKSSSSGPARSTSRKATPAGAGSGRASCTRSTSAPRLATCGSIKRRTARTSVGSGFSSTARRTSSWPRWRPR